MDQREQYAFFLEEKAVVSLPEIQRFFSCTYQQAKEKMEYFRRKNWVSQKITVLHAQVNTQLLCRRELSEQEFDHCLESLEYTDISVLESLEEQSQPDFSGIRITMDSHARQLGRLLSCRLIHTFDEKYFPSVTEAAVKRLRQSVEAEPDELCIACIAHPILYQAVEQKADIERLLELPFIPDDCRSYIKEGLLDYLMQGKKPQKILRSDRWKQSNALHFEVLEAFVTQTDYETKEQYVEEAKRNLAMILESEVCPEGFKEAAKAAVKELTEDLTLSNIREIKRIVSQRSEDEDDD